MVSVINNRADTTSPFGGGAGGDKEITLTFPDGAGQTYSDQGRSYDQYIDTLRSKFYTVVEDGYQWGSGYARTELNYSGGYGHGHNPYLLF